jgi:phosphatidylglycerol:prolipoprotein diacylglycerol transferase
VVSGILGSRIFYYVEFYDVHFAHRPLWVMFAIWEGGIVFYGGLLAGMATVLAYLKLKGLHVLKFADILATTIPLGLSFGRLGCFLNGCCWGKPVVGPAGKALGVPTPWYALEFPPGSPAFARQVEMKWINESAPSCLPVHGTQLYEWFGAWVLVALLALVYRYHSRHGQVFAALMVLYGPLRYVIEGLREHARAERMVGYSWLWDPIAGDFMTKSQTVSIGMVAAGIALFTFWSLRGEAYERPSARAT